jgi:hypothetical protein
MPSWENSKNLSTGFVPLGGKATINEGLIKQYLTVITIHSAELKASGARMPWMQRR